MLLLRFKKKKLKSTQKKQVFYIFDIKGTKNFNLVTKVLLYALFDPYWSRILRYDILLYFYDI